MDFIRNRAGVLVLMLVFALALPACTGPGGPRTATDAGAMGAFDPAAMRIYPLTHVEKGAASGPTQIICHVEFTDRWFDTVKALGTLQILLYRPGGGLNPGVDVQQATWDMNLMDLSKNAEWFDPVTRTYRVQLELPAWAEAESGSQIRLRAIFTPAGARGLEGALHDEFALRV